MKHELMNPERIKLLGFVSMKLAKKFPNTIMLISNYDSCMIIKIKFPKEKTK